MRTRLPFPRWITAGAFLWLLLAAVAPGPVQAQTPAPAAPHAAGTPGLAPAQARQALEVLRDPKRRDELISTLEAIEATGAAAAAPGAPTSPTTSPGPAGTAPGAAAGAAAPGSPAAAPAAEPASKLPLAPDSLAVQFVDQVSAGLAVLGAQLVLSLQTVNDMPLLWRWIVSDANDPEATALLFEAAWKLVVVLAISVAAERGATLLLRRVRAALSLGARTRPSPPPPPDVPETQPDDLAASDPGERGRSARLQRLTGALGALRRLPFLFGRMLLDLVPAALFATVANILVGTALGQPATTRGTILLVVQSYLLARVILAVTALLCSPAGSTERLLHISDWAAAFITRWIRRVAIMALIGFTVAGIGLQFNIYRTAYETLLKLFALVVHILLVVAILQARQPIARRIRARHDARGAWATLLNRIAEIWHLIAIFYVMALWLVWAVELRNGYARLLHFFVVTAAVSIVARISAIMLLGGLDKARMLPGLATRLPGFEGRANFYYPILRGTLLSLIGIATAMALIEVWGFDLLGWFRDSGLGGRALSAVLLIGTTVLVAVLVWEGANAAIELHLAQLSASAQVARAGRLRTLLPMLRTVLLVTIVLVVLLMTLEQLGVNIAPLLAGAGVVGIAVGFGSQKLVQDLITGLFLLLENAMQVGDVVTLGGLSGTVEALSIRTIRLRALDGSIHIIPFSAVTTVTNQTRDYSYAVIDVSIGLNEEPDRVIDVLKKAADAMRREPRWQNIVLEPLDIMGVEKFVDLAWVLRVRMKTQPSSRWSVARELNRRIKVTFDEQGIESPFTSHRALSTPEPSPAEDKPNERVDARAAE